MYSARRVQDTPRALSNLYQNDILSDRFASAPNVPLARTKVQKQFWSLVTHTDCVFFNQGIEDSSSLGPWVKKEKLKLSTPIKKLMAEN